MGVYILSYPPVSLTPPQTLFPIEMQWIGWDGSVWDLQTGGQGVVMRNDGVVGLHLPRADRFLSESRAIPGHRIRGSRVKARRVIWPLLIHAKTSADWLYRDAGFWQTMDPEKPGIWRVTVGTQVRELQCAAVFEADHAYSLDPYKNGWAIYVAELEAAQPYWMGEVQSQRFELGAGAVDFIPGGGAPPFTISRGSTFAEAAITNPGTVPAYPTWTIAGPLDNVFVGVGGVTVEVPFAVNSGEVLRLDTDPRNQSATLDGVDVTATLGFQNFASIPAGGVQPLSVAATGTGTIDVELRPLYKRAF